MGRIVFAVMSEKSTDFTSSRFDDLLYCALAIIILEVCRNIVTDDSPTTTRQNVSHISNDENHLPQELDKLVEPLPTVVDSPAARSY